MFVVSSSCAHLHLHVPTLSFPTRRSSDLFPPPSGNTSIHRANSSPPGGPSPRAGVISAKSTANSAVVSSQNSHGRQPKSSAAIPANRNAAVQKSTSPLGEELGWGPEATDRKSTRLNSSH